MPLLPPAQGRPWRIAVVGSGPSGFYAVQALHRLRDFPVQVDLFDRLPTPFGLVRGGVAPDHQNIKAVTRSYDRQAGRTEGLRFFGNVQVGRDLSVADLDSLYDATIWANGHEGARTLGIPGEDLDGVASAAHFVFWYNGHPDHVDRTYPLARAEKAVVVGNGNVAIDVARILSQDPERLALTDIAQQALDQLRLSAVRTVGVLGRRGPEQASFTPTELAELAELPCLDLRVGPDGVAEPHPDEADAAVRKNLELLRRQASREPLGRPRSIRLRFFVSPIAFVGDDQGRLRAVRLARNALVERGGRLSAQPTGEVWEEPCQLALTAIGYRGLQIPGMPFDPQLGRMPSEAGRVLAAPGGPPLPGHYVVGWARRGPTGVVGTNKPDAEDTVARLWEDYLGEAPPMRPATDVAALLDARGVRAVSFEEWRRIDAAEQLAGKLQGRVRVKLTSVAEMLDLLAKDPGADQRETAATPPLP